MANIRIITDDCNASLDLPEEKVREITRIAFEYASIACNDREEDKDE